MKQKNLYMQRIGDELELLRATVDHGGTSGSERQKKSEKCAEIHFSLCRHLIRDFITPVEREDLYRVSNAILRAVVCVEREGDLCSGRTKKALSACVDALCREPFRMDVSAVRRVETVRKLCEENAGAPASVRDCFSACLQVAEALLETVIKNA